MKPEQKAFLDRYPSKPVYYSYFCGEPELMPLDIKADLVPRNINNA
jgi:hypothetical protein